MTKIYIGTEVLRTNAAIEQLKENIKFLQSKVDHLDLNNALASQVQDFYLRKLESQRSLLDWLSSVNECASKASSI